MAAMDIADEYYTYESRLSSFQTAHQLSKRRTSNANSKAVKSLKWPHKFIAAEELARAGFFFYPTQDNPDNVACFLCQRSVDGWEKGDDPLVEHLKHSSECGWAIVATIQREDGDLSQEYPSSTRMIEARKATFSDKWPHESKKGWKCKIKQMVDAGWKYTPTPEYDDMATCTYCDLALDGWEPADKPMEEHFKRSPNCAFFTLIGNHKQSPAGKRTKAKNHRASKASRLSTQSAFTINSDTASVTDLPAEEGDSILTTATNATTFQGGKRMAKGKKPTTTKGRKTKAKKSEAVEVLPAPEPEDDDFEVKVDLPPKSTRGRKRKTEDVIDSAALMEEMVALPSKRRATRTRASVAGNDSALGPDDSTMAVEPSKLVAAGRKKGRQSTRKASAASMASLRAPIPNDDELDAALEADLEQRMTDDEDHPIMAKASSRNLSIADHNMFGTEGVKIDEVAIDAELIAMEEGSKALPKAKGAKGKLPRKVSAKQQAAAKKAAEAEAAAQKGIEEGEDVSRRTSTELEQSISTHHSSPVIKPKRQRVSRQPSRQLPGRSTRGSVLSVNESHVSINDDTIMLDQNDESGNETDASMASQSTVVRASKNRRGSTLRRAKGGKKAETRHIEEIVHKTTRALSGSVDTSLPVPLIGETEDVSTADERFYTPAPEAHDPIIEEPVPQISKPNTSKPRGRPLKAAAEPAPSQQRLDVEKHAMEEQPAILPREKLAKVSVALPVRIQTPPLKERTPSESPQSSDAENHPPSSKPTASSKRVVTPRATVARVPLAASTPSMSPSKRNIIAGLQTTQPWTGVDLDAIFLKTPGNENAPSKGMLGDALDKARKGYLTSPEKKMTVEEWIHHNAGMAEEKLRSECERMVGTFEREGARAMIALEGIDCVE